MPRALWDCKPSQENLVHVKNRSGAYVKKIGSQSIYRLCLLAENKQLSLSIIREELSLIWPRSKPISKKNVFYVRVKVNRLLLTFLADKDYEVFKQNVTDYVLLEGIDNAVNIQDDEVHVFDTQLWKEVLSENPDNRTSIVTFVEYLNLLRSSTKGFVCDLAIDEHGNTNGVVWQTATVRDNFERFGGFISLDTMKQANDKWLWPYMSVAMYNKMRMLCLGCEGIMCGERADAYEFMSRFLIKNLPDRPLEDVNAVAGDGLFNQISARR